MRPFPEPQAWVLLPSPQTQAASPTQAAVRVGSLKDPHPSHNIPAHPQAGGYQGQPPEQMGDRP